MLPVAAALLVFAGLGLGLAIPFLLLGYIPALRRVLPKPGAWMETMRHILAVPMFLTALGLCLGARQPDDGGRRGARRWRRRCCSPSGGGGPGGVSAASRRFRLDAGRSPRSLLAIAAGATLLPKHQDVAKVAQAGASVPFDAAKLAALRAANKAGVPLLHRGLVPVVQGQREGRDRARPRRRRRSRKAGVTTMVGDWTDGDAAIGKFLDAHGRSGVPLYLWYAPGKEAQTLPQILTPGCWRGWRNRPIRNPFVLSEVEGQAAGTTPVRTERSRSAATVGAWPSTALRPNGGARGERVRRLRSGRTGRGSRSLFPHPHPLPADPRLLHLDRRGSPGGRRWSADRDRPARNPRACRARAIPSGPPPPPHRQPPW